MLALIKKKTSPLWALGDRAHVLKEKGFKTYFVFIYAF